MATNTITPAEVGGLVKRLRGIPVKWIDLRMGEEAADAIEALTDALAAEHAAHAETKRELDAARQALEPFANIEPSTAVAHDGSEAEPYCVYLACRDRFDFTGADLAAARRVREQGGENNGS